MLTVVLSDIVSTARALLSLFYSIPENIALTALFCLILLALLALCCLFYSKHYLDSSVSVVLSGIVSTARALLSLLCYILS